MKTDHSKIGAGAFGVVHRAAAVGIREGEDQVMLMDERIPYDSGENDAEEFSDGGGSQVCEAICRKGSAKGAMRC